MARRSPIKLFATVLTVSLTACTSTSSDGVESDIQAQPELPATFASEVEITNTAGPYLAGQHALGEGDVRAAADFFETALGDNPDNLDLRGQIFVLRLAAGDYDAALESARILAEADTGMGEVRFLLAFEQVRAGNYQAAIDQLDEASETGVVAMLKPMLISWAYYGEGDSEAGLDLLAEQDEEDGIELVREYHRGSMLSLLDRNSEALEVLEPIVRTGERTPTRLVQELVAVEVLEGQAEAAEEIIVEQLSLQASNLPLEQLLQQVKANEEIEPPITDANSGMADALLSLSRALSDQRANSQALIFARLGAYLSPEQGDIWLLIGQIALAQDDPEEAISAFRQIADGSPYKWDARLLEAQALDELEQTDDAVEILRALAEEHPERFDTLVTLGDMLRRHERYAEAEEAYGTAIDRIDSLTPGHWRLLYAHGITLERIDRWSEAEERFQKALELQPEQPFVLNYLGYSWVDKGLNLDEAKGMLNRAVELRPEDGFIVDSLGWAHYRLGDMEDAVTYLERAVELEPGDPVINDHLGDAYWRVGREREARYQWERALIFEPEEDVVTQIEEKLRDGLPEDEAERG